jgi:D-alanine-D-alanine ligase
MKIGITFDLRTEANSALGSANGAGTPGGPGSPGPHPAVGPTIIAGDGVGHAAASCNTAPGRDTIAAFAARLRDAQDSCEEFDSPRTIAALAAALESLGHEVLLLGDGPPLVESLLHGTRPDLVFNLAEGQGTSRTREARVPALLEMLGIPYTGSDPLTLAATLDKDCAKRLVQSHGVATPAWVLVPDGNIQPLQDQLDRLPRPWLAKPAFEGSSKGIFSLSVLQTRAELAEAVAQLHEAYQQPVLVEEFIEGEELTVAVLDDGRPDVLGMMRIVPRVAMPRFVYSLEVKRDYERLVRYECPAQLAPAIGQRVAAAALAAWHALGCRDVARFDFRLRDGVPYFLEVNPLPGLAPISSDLVILAEKVGLSYPELIGKIVASALRRSGQAGGPSTWHGDSGPPQAESAAGGPAGTAGSRPARDTWVSRAPARPA